MLKCCSMLDLKTEKYSRPMLVENLIEAERVFQQGCKDPQTTLGQYPDDFQLFYIGDFDQDTGKFHQTEHHLLAQGGVLVRKESL